MAHLDTISPAEAYAIASSWGSYINGSDPGLIFYTFPCGDARPQDEDHRRDCLEYTTTLQSRTDLSDEDQDDLATLADFFARSPIRA